MVSNLIFTLMIFMPIAVIAVLILADIIGVGEKVHSQTIAWRNQQVQLETLPEVIKRNFLNNQDKGIFGSWNGYIRRQINRTEWKISSYSYMLLTIVLPIISLAMAFLLSRNIFLTITVSILVVFIPMLILSWAVRKYDQKIMDQLSTGIQLFSIEFEMVKNVREALLRAANGVLAPLREHILSLVQDLTASKNPKQAYTRFARSLGCEYGRVWAQMLIASTEDITMIKMMPLLIKRLSSQRLLVQKNITDLSGERRIGIILNLLIIPGFILTQIFFPDSTLFYEMTLGRLVIVLVVISILTGILLDNLLKKIDL